MTEQKWHLQNVQGHSSCRLLRIRLRIRDLSKWLLLTAKS